MKNLKTAGILLSGALVGYVWGLLTTPITGKVIREKINEESNNLISEYVK